MQHCRAVCAVRRVRTSSCHTDHPPHRLWDCGGKDNHRKRNIPDLRTEILSSQDWCFFILVAAYLRRLCPWIPKYLEATESHILGVVLLIRQSLRWVHIKHPLTDVAYLICHNSYMSMGTIRRWKASSSCPR